MTQASRNNEGKIHLGLVYAKDRSLETAKTMIEGAIHFTACLERWIDLPSIDPLVSTPFYYAIHKDTMTDPIDLERHYHDCQRLFDEACSATGLLYLGRERRLMVEEVSIEAAVGLVSPHQLLRLYRTSELGRRCTRYRGPVVRGSADQPAYSIPFRRFRLERHTAGREEDVRRLPRQRSGTSGKLRAGGQHPVARTLSNRFQLRTDSRA